jgi:lycopene cyclase domain-containing protein
VGHLTYLALLAGCLVVTAPLELVLRVRVYARWRRLLLAVVPEFVVFVVWVLYAIAQGHWDYSGEPESDRLGRGLSRRGGAAGGATAMSYSVLAVAAVVAVLVVDLAVYRTRMVTRPVFWTAYAIVIVFQLLMNGVLTGLDVVTYDPDAIWGLRIAYAPVEDLLFGFAMVTLTLASWAAVNRRANTARRRGLDTDTRPSSTR